MIDVPPEIATQRQSESLVIRRELWRESNGDDGLLVQTFVGGFPAHTARFRLEDTVARRREKDSIIGIGGRRREGDDRTIDWRNRFGLPNAPTREPFGGYARQHRT